MTELIHNSEPGPGQVRWRVGSRTLDEVVWTMLDLPPDRLPTANMIHHWRLVWREKHPNLRNRAKRISEGQTLADLRAGESVKAFRREGVGTGERWQLVPEVLGL